MVHQLVGQLVSLLFHQSFGSLAKVSTKHKSVSTSPPACSQSISEPTSLWSVSQSVCWSISQSVNISLFQSTSLQSVSQLAKPSAETVHQQSVGQLTSHWLLHQSAGSQSISQSVSPKAVNVFVCQLASSQSISKPTNQLGISPSFR